MPSFGPASLANLRSVHTDLIRLCQHVVQGYDCTVLEGVRSADQQRLNVAKGVSKTLDSKHVLTGGRQFAEAVDMAPYPLRWPKRDSPTYQKDLARFYCFGGYVMSAARCLNVPLRWGGDWAGTWDFAANAFDDLVHFELGVIRASSPF